MAEVTPDNVNLQDILLAQTGRVGWPELARHFARGRLVIVGPDQDLTQLAEDLIRDDAAKFESLVESGQVRAATDRDAIGWNESSPTFWAVVVAPWVLVQPIPDQP